jgi:hypothetical protein
VSAESGQLAAFRGWDTTEIHTNNNNNNNNNVE